MTEEKTTDQKEEKVEDPKTVEEKELGILGYLVRVKVIDVKDSPVEGANVTLTSEIREAVTDEKGEVLFENVEPGEHTIKIVYENQVGEQTINLEGDDVKEFKHTIQIKEKNPFLSLPVLLVIGVLLLWIVKNKLPLRALRK